MNDATIRNKKDGKIRAAGRVSYELRNKPRSPWSLCGSVVEHRSAESKGLRFDSSWGLRIFSLSHARDKTKKTLLLGPLVFCDIENYLTKKLCDNNSPQWANIMAVKLTKDGVE